MRLLPEFVDLVQTGLLPELRLESVDPYDPIEVRQVPAGWQWLGAGNYAAVCAHPAYPAWVVKIYAPGRPGLADEVEVYRKLGEHPAYSQCLHAGANFLVLRRLEGVTLYECFRRGIPIPPQVIADIDSALAYARAQGLYPQDVHAKNVMLANGRGLVVDVSDFGQTVSCSKWDDLKRAYDRFYRPLLYRWPVPIPGALLNAIRKGYRLFKRLGA